MNAVTRCASGPTSRACRCFTGSLLGLALAGALVGCGGPGRSAGSLPPTPAPTPTIAITGASQVRIGSTVQFAATVTNTSNPGVTWLVNGVPGGSILEGTISANGLYVPPSTIPNPNTVTISATTETTPAASASASESILNPVPVVTSATATPGSSPGAYTVAVIGTGFIPTSQVEVAGGVAGPTTFVSGTQLTATITPSASATSAAISVSNPDPGSAVSSPLAVTIVSLTAAARLLDQATFGPTLTDLHHVQQVGLQGYLAEQFALPPTLLPDIPNPPPALCPQSVTPCEQSEWWGAALTAPDQLRQRIAFALSEIFVISTDSESARAVTPYQNILASDAFTNYATILHDVTLSPGMGLYLNMMNSNKPAAGEIANENYPRELMQLFTLGLSLLNADGTLELDANGQPQPVYTEAQVQAFARVYTGWTFADSSGGSASKFPNNTPNYDAPMAAVESAHDTAAKTLLLGTVLPAGQTAEQDLAGALANIFNHPNIGPFVGRQLIQHLVSSHPTPAYVARVAAAFADNGQGVRGDMKAVITAILTDPEARAGDTDPASDGGHLREPLLYMANVMRGLGFVNTSAGGTYNTISNYTSPLGQQPYNSPSVFNFFPPSYVIPGSDLNAPEFGEENTASTILRLTLANSLVFNRIAGFSVDLSASGTLGRIASATGDAQTDSGSLADALGLIFMHGGMPPDTRAAIVNQVATLTDPAERVRVATYLVITSSEYKIEH